MRGNRGVELRPWVVLAVLCAVFISCSSAVAVTIDVFSSPSPGEVFSLNKTAADWWRQYEDSAILGGQRDVSAQAHGTIPRWSCATGFIGNDPDVSDGYSQVGSVGGSVGTQLTLQYDGLDTEDDSDLNAGSGLNYNLRSEGADRFSFRFGWIDGGDAPALGVKVSVLGTAGGSGQYTGAFDEFTFGEGPKSYEIRFEDFTVLGPNPFDSAASVTIDLNPKPELGIPVPNADFLLLDIRTTPEPSTLLLAAIGGGLLWAWYRWRGKPSAK